MGFNIGKVIKKHPIMTVGIVGLLAVFVYLMTRQESTPVGSNQGTSGSGTPGGLYVLQDELGLMGTSNNVTRDAAGNYHTVQDSSFHKKGHHVVVHHPKQKHSHGGTKGHPIMHTGAHDEHHTGTKQHVKPGTRTEVQQVGKAVKKQHHTLATAQTKQIKQQHALKQVAHKVSKKGQQLQVKPNPHAGGAHGWVYTTKPGDTLNNLQRRFWPGSNALYGGSGANIMKYGNNTQIIQSLRHNKNFLRTGILPTGTKINA